MAWKRWCLVLLWLGLPGLTAVAEATVTEKVDAMIAENTPLKVRDSDLGFVVGGPLVFGVQYEQYATQNWMIGGGIGSFVDGTSVDLEVRYNILGGKFTPYLSGGGAFYYINAKQNVFALFGSLGLAYTFDNGLGFTLGVVYDKAVSKSEVPFSNQWINDSLNWVSPQMGLHFNF